MAAILLSHGISGFKIIASGMLFWTHETNFVEIVQYLIKWTPFFVDALIMGNAYSILENLVFWPNSYQKFF